MFASTLAKYSSATVLCSLLCCVATKEMYGNITPYADDSPLVWASTGSWLSACSWLSATKTGALWALFAVKFVVVATVSVIALAVVSSLAIILPYVTDSDTRKNVWRAARSTGGFYSERETVR